MDSGFILMNFNFIGVINPASLQETMRSPIVVLAIIAVSLMLTPMAFAPAVLDQVNDPAPTAYRSFGPVPSSVWQSFTPTVSSLVGVDVRLRNTDTESHTVVIKIREGSPSGTVLGSQPLVVTPTSSSLFHVDFPLISLTPGSTYLIELHWDSAGDLYVYWADRSDNPYPGGTAFSPGGIAWPDNDFNFRTWGPEVIPAPEFGAPTAIIASMAVMAYFLIRHKLHILQR